MVILFYIKTHLLEIPLKNILIILTIFLLSFPFFGLSEEVIQLKTFYQETETSNSAFEELHGPMLFPDKRLELFQDEDLENEASLEKKYRTKIEEKKVSEAVTEIDYVNPKNLQQNDWIHEVKSAYERQGTLSYRKENGAWGWYDYGDEESDGKYVGDIVNMKPNGLGIFIYGKGKWAGDSYHGQWKDGEFHGKGKFTRTNGQIFFGEWKNSWLWNINGYDKFGRIIKKYRKGEKLIIRKKDELEKKNALQKRGRGILYREVPLSKWERGGKKWMTEGDSKIHGIYEGEILNSLPDGEGIYSWYNVEKYVGEFRKGFFHGHGTFTYLSGITSEGVFRKNKEWDTIRTEETGKVTGKYVKGRYFQLKN